jgi:uncharacterized lipoprotein YmbA
MNRLFTQLGIFVLCCLLGGLLSSCSSPSRVTTYYSLYSASPPRALANPNDDIVLSVGPVTVSDVLTLSKLTTGGEDGVFQRSEYHKWVGAVDKDFARSLAEQLASELKTEQIFLHPGDNYLEPNCQLLIDVLAMDGKLGMEAKLTVRWTLIDPQKTLPPMTRRNYFRRQPVDGSHSAWVKAQQENIKQLSIEIAAVINERFQ